MVNHTYNSAIDALLLVKLMLLHRYVENDDFTQML